MKRINIHAFLVFFGIAVALIVITGITGSFHTAVVSVFWGTAGYGVLLLIAKFVNRDMLKVQKKLNKKNFYILDYSLLVTSLSGGQPGLNDAGYIVHYQSRPFQFKAGRAFEIGGALVREMELVSDRHHDKYCVAFNRDGTIDVYIATRKSASLS